MWPAGQGQYESMGHDECSKALGYDPALHAQVRALTGDVKDNLRGLLIPAAGGTPPKRTAINKPRAAQLLHEYGGLPGLLAGAATASRLRETERAWIHEHSAGILKAWQVARLRTDAQLPGLRRDLRVDSMDFLQVNAP